ncbi:GON-4-like protein isoform X2 [Brachyhypopomus gauderio]|uniref:GON-4-like protein isoform X2 n=1 Tax=Brachyhypopomus gauderio TaxID=698409 RepID=UPI0040419666
MIPVRRRRLGNVKAGHLLPDPASACLDTGSDPSKEDLRRSTRSKGVVQNAVLSLSSEDETERSLVITVDGEQGCAKQSGRRKGGVKRKSEMSGVFTEEDPLPAEEEIQPEVEIDQDLDRELENKSRQHKLTSANVRNILHEVITNEHVVAMMKAAINETEPVPLFEPKMTRSKLKEVVEKGVVIPTWNISPIKKPCKMKGPQFVDIPLEEEDSSDEEYCPDEEEDEETAEDTLLESDLESTASSPRGTRLNLNRSFAEHGENSCSPRQSLRRARHLQVEVVPMGPPPPPQGPDPPGPARECSFMEKLHAVDEELAIGSDCIHPYQTLSSEGEESLMAFRTRSKRPLRDVPLGRLEAELRAPDITPDMYEPGSALEDREWSHWLQGLMSSDMENEEEGDDEDDPEYNFLADIDEPDVEDYRNDKAVRITKREVNDLMEELFDAFQDELGGQDEEGHEEEEEKEEEDSPQQPQPSVLETIQYEDPLADVLNQRYSTVREQLAALRKRKALLESKGVALPPPRPKRPTSPASPLFLSPAQKLRLQQHIQQHVQLLTQVSMLSRPVEGLQMEACTTRQFLAELQVFARRGEEVWCGIQPAFVSIFRACNLEPALSLLQELDNAPPTDPQSLMPLFPGSVLSAALAWLLATRPVFLYPELLPHVDLRPFHYKGPFTSAENCLVVLGHQHLKGTVHPLKLTCQYLLAARNIICVRTHIRSACHKQSPNIIKKYFLEGRCAPMPLACESVSPSDQRPPVERDTRLMPWWIKQNLKLIHEEVIKYNQPYPSVQPMGPEGSCVSSDITPVTLSAPPHPTAPPPTIFPPGTRYPPCLPEALALSLIKPQLPPAPGSSRTKALLQSTSPTSTQPPDPPTPVPPGLEEALRRLQPIRPKPPGQTPPSLGVVEPRIAVPSAAHVAPADTGQGNVIITLPAAPLATAFICPAPAANQEAQTVSAFTPLAKENMSERCGTLLKLSTDPRLSLGPPSPKALSLSQNTLHSLLLLTPGCVVTSGRCESTFSNPVPLLDHSQKHSSQHAAPTGDSQSCLENISRRSLVSNAAPVDRPSSGHPAGHKEGRLKENDCFQETTEVGELDTDEAVVAGEEEEEEVGGETFRRPFLTLSESSGSPASALAEEDDTTSPVCEVTLVSAPKLKLTSEPEADDESYGGVSETLHSGLLYDDLSDHDPHRDIKDVAFAQAYIEKVCQALRLVPGRVEEFLSVLRDFEQDPKARTSVELYMRLRPVLGEWPELLRDFAAFLHPDQAHACGLLVEQQAFERSRRFLRRLELIFGEQSPHYRRVVRTLQQGPPKSRACSEEMKAQITMLFRGHANLLEEFWAFFEQLHHPKQRHSDDGEEEEEDEVECDQTDGVSSLWTTHGMKGSRQTQRIGAPCPEMRAEPARRQPHAQSFDVGSRNTDPETDVESQGDARRRRPTSGRPVGARNSSRMPSGEKVVLWTREADRVILTTCQQRGANQSTFRCIAAQLGRKTAAEVSSRYQDLIQLFRKSSREQHLGWSDTEVQPSPKEKEPD